MDSVATAPSGSQSLIAKPAYFGVVITFFALAIVVFVLRMSIRVHRAQGLHVDDYFLILAILCLIASFGFFMAIIPSLFLFNDVLAGLAPLPTNFLQLSVNTALGDAIGETMAWTAIYAVKLSFLFVFRTLVRRIRPLEILWLCTFIICIPTAGVSISATWIICPHPNINPLASCTGSSLLRAEIVMLCFTLIFDVVTDALLVSIPIALLWRTRLSTRHKMSIGVVLCLSTVMICINLVRAISAPLHGMSDQIWVAFWVQVEASVATIMVCLSVFRQLFVQRGSSSSRRQAQEGWRRFSPTRHTPGDGSRIERYKRFFSKKSSVDGEDIRLPRLEIGATVIGMKTTTREKGAAEVENSQQNSSAQEEIDVEATEPRRFIYYKS